MNDGDLSVKGAILLAVAIVSIFSLGFIVPTSKEPNVIIQPLEDYYDSGMPCERSYENEQETSEETVQETVWSESERDGRNDYECGEGSGYEETVGDTGKSNGADDRDNETLCGRSQEDDLTYEQTETEEADVLQDVERCQNVQETNEEISAPEPEPVCDTYASEEWLQETVAVSQMGQSVFEILESSLTEAGIGWWYPYAVAQMTQESRCDPWAENINGLDKGLFQYRITYWQEPESIFDVNAQIRRYTREVQARINAGLSIEEVISRHYTSDWVTEVNWQYVQDVLQWMP